MASVDTEYLVSIMREAEAAAHGGKGAIYQRACDFLCISPQTLHNKLKEIKGRTRKRRADAGKPVMPLDEAKLVSSFMMEGIRKNGKKLVSVKKAVSVLRGNGLIVAARIDDKTGEMMPLSESAVTRALITYNLHPEQLMRPTPHVHLRSLHPNHVWQVDASVCTLYYLPSGESLIETERAVHYKNKPENLRAIEQFRVIRYVVTDHCSGVIRWRYFPHSESGENTLRFLVWAMLPKGKLTQDPFYGVPFIVMVDPGATAAGLIKRFCERMHIELIVNQAGAPRAKGQVENAQNIVETQFEQGLRFCGRAVRSIEHLNQVADTFQVYFNHTAEHSRHKMRRFEAWMHILPEQLRIIPEGVDLFTLATSAPETRIVQGDLTVQYLGKGRTWKVNNVPFAQVGDTLTVCQNPLTGMVMAVVIGENGRETHFQLEEMHRDKWGFFEDGAAIGESFVSHKDTQIDSNRKEVARIATGETSVEAAEKKRKRKGYEPFEGKIDPFIEAKTAVLTDTLPRKGTAMDGQQIDKDLIRMNLVQMAQWLRGRLQDDYRPEMLADLQRRFPEGATEPDLETVLADIAAGRTAAGRAHLKAV